MVNGMMENNIAWFNEVEIKSKYKDIFDLIENYKIQDRNKNELNLDGTDINNHKR